MNEFYFAIQLQQSVKMIASENTYLLNAESLFLNSDEADVVFVCEEEKIPAHKFVLERKNLVFQTVFFRSFEEIKITDVYADAMREFLQFFYLRKIVLTRRNIGDVIYLCLKYIMPECLEYCFTELERLTELSDINELRAIVALTNHPRPRALLERFEQFSLHSRRIFILGSVFVHFSSKKTVTVSKIHIPVHGRLEYVFFSTKHIMFNKMQKIIMSSIGARKSINSKNASKTVLKFDPPKQLKASKKYCIGIFGIDPLWLAVVNKKHYPLSFSPNIILKVE